MKKTKKSSRIFAILLALFMVVGAFPMSAPLAYGYAGESGQEQYLVDMPVYESDQSFADVYKPADGNDQELTDINKPTDGNKNGNENNQELPDVDKPTDGNENNNGNNQELTDINKPTGGNENGNGNNQELVDINKPTDKYEYDNEYEYEYEYEKEQAITAMSADGDITVYISFEGYNLGHGFYIAPTALTLPAGSTGEDATRARLDMWEQDYITFGEGVSFFLYSVDGFNRGFKNPPKYITIALSDCTNEGGPLSAFMYSASSGWIVTINHVLIDEGVGAFALNDGDVIRWQFSVVGLGADLGVPFFGGEPLYVHSDKTELIRTLFVPGISVDARQAALDVIIAPLATDAEVASALAALTSNGSQLPPDDFWFELSGLSLTPAQGIAAINEILIEEFGQPAGGPFDYSVVQRLRISGTLANTFFNWAAIRGNLGPYLVELDLSGLTGGTAPNIIGMDGDVTARYTALRHITMPAGMNSISGFANNTALESITWAGNVNQIGPNSVPTSFFQNTPALRYLIFKGDTAPTFSNNATNANLMFGGRALIAYVLDKTTGGYELEAFYRHFVEVRNIGESNIPDVDRTELSAVIAKAEALEESHFTTATWNALQVQLNAARVTYERENATQAEINQAKNRLNEAINALILYGLDITFIRVPVGTTVGVFARGNNAFAQLTYIELTRISEESCAEYDVYSVNLPLNTNRHLEAVIFGSDGEAISAKYARTIRVSQHGTTIEVSPTLLSEWGNANARAWESNNMYTNLPESGAIHLQQGKSFDLDMFRVWQIILGATGNTFLEPHFEFRILEGNSVSVSRGGAPGREQLQIVGVSQGLSIIEVTYGPAEFFHTAGSNNVFRFDGIDGQNVLLIPVFVGTEGAFETGITARNDFDTFYFDVRVGHREFTFTPEQGSNVRVRNPISGKWATYTEEEDGSFVVRLHAGRNIIEVENNGAMRYHNVHARSAQVTVVNETNPGAHFEVGDIAVITVSGLQEPVEKLSGIYNPGVDSAIAARIRYFNEAGEQFTSNVAAQYRTLATDFTIRYELTDIDKNVLTGQIYVGWFGEELGTHRNVPLLGIGQNFTAPTYGLQGFGALPVIVLPTTPDGGSTDKPDWQYAMERALERIRTTTENPTVGVAHGEWAVMALARAGVVDDIWFGIYLDNLAANLPSSGELHPESWTDHARVVLALSALDIDASEHEGHDLTALFRTFIPENVRPSRNRNLNADVWALIALDSRPYEGDREEFVSAILEAQLSNGAWRLSAGVSPDIDLTAMAITALAPYYADSPQVQTAVANALAWLDAQTIPDAEGNAQVIVALSALGKETLEALGIDPLYYVNALLTFFDESSGGFRRGNNVNAIATEQAAYALVAYYRFVNEQNRLFDMSDAIGINQKPEVDRAGLNTAITSAQNRMQMNYTAASWSSMQTVLASAIQVRDNANATQEEVNAARDALNAAIAELVLFEEPGDIGGGGPGTTPQERVFLSVRDPFARAGQTSLYFQGYLNLRDGETAYSILRRAETGLSISSRGHAQGGRYVESINGFGEFDDGPLSGWMFRVNGSFPDYSSSLRTLSDGDRVEWLFTRDLGVDIGARRVDEDDDEETTNTQTPAQEDEAQTLNNIIQIGDVSTLNNPFNDIAYDNWFFRYVMFAHINGLMDGIYDDTFSPNTNLSRAMIVTMLWRLQGEPVAQVDDVFNDVQSGNWYSEAIAWAYESGIVRGIGGGQFAPHDYVTREQLAVIFYNFAQLDKSNTGVEFVAELNYEFADVSYISGWALNAMKWANAKGLITGRTQTTLVPHETATRAESAAILYRFVNAGLR